MKQLSLKLGDKVAANKDIFTNACALRLSYALNEAGHKIPYAKGKTSSGANGDWYFYRVSDLVVYLNGKYEQYTSPTQSDLAGTKAIIYQTDCGWRDASGHVDIWDGTNSLHQYYEGCKKVYIWRLN